MHLLQKGAGGFDLFVLEVLGDSTAVFICGVSVVLQDRLIGSRLSLVGQKRQKLLDDTCREIFDGCDCVLEHNVLPILSR